MAYARVVTFDGVEPGAIEELKREISEGDRPEGLPASEVIFLYDRDAGRSMGIVFFETEEDYRQGDEALNAMSPPSGAGTRSSVGKYEVAIRRSE
jgi:hypothetical protein